MMRRFSRRRRGGERSGGGGSPIDAGSLLERIRELGVVPAASLAPYEADEVPAELAVVGSGESSSGGRIFVTASPRDAGHALVAALALGGRLAEAESFDGDLYAVAPEWGSGARALLGVVGRVPFRLNALAAPAVSADGGRVLPGRRVDGAVLSPAQIAGHLAGPSDRELFLRAARGLEGLAAKHGGALRGHGRSVDFVLLARRVAELRAESGGGVSLTTLLPQRQTSRLAADNLSGSLDGLEGQLRKRLNDRRIREGEEGLRARAIGAFRSWHSLRALVPWPLGGEDREVIDWVGVDVEGRPVIGAAREELTLGELASVLESALALQVYLPVVLAHAAAPVVLDAPRLVLGGRSIARGVGRVLETLNLSHELFEIRGGADLELRAVAAGEAAAVETRPSGRRRPPATREPSADEQAVEARAESGEGTEAAEGTEGAEGADSGEGGERGEREEGRSSRSRARRGRGRGRRGGRARGEGGAGESAAAEARSSDEGEGEGDEEADERGTSRFEEVSLFDLDDEPAESGGGRGRRRRRGRRRGRTGSGDDTRGESGGGEDRSSAGADGPGGRRSAGAEARDAEVDESELDEDLLGEDDELELADLPDFEPEAPAYDDDEEEEAGDEAQAPVRVRPRPAPVEEAAEAPQLPRRRSAIVTHADRDSIAAAVLIARDVRTVEGIWVYPQAELMSFFRGVTTDLRDDTPIYVVGFRPKPAIDVLQTASLYRGRLQWFDHQDWPPEDLQALRDTLGEEAVHVTPGTGSSLPAVLDCCSRRSRFTDKLVDLMAARFSEHDYERWGRLWWWRLGEIAGKTGDRRADLDALLTGRPSDLAREAARVETPPLPAEVDYVSRRDFRLVHFAGYGLVVVDVPPELDVHLAARVARERYGASLALAMRPDSEYVYFSGDELAGRRSLDLGALVEHVTNKLEWVEQLSNVDHVARMRVRQLASHPERLDEIVAEIAMGRSILER